MKKIKPSFIVILTCVLISISASAQYKIHFNRVLCLNPWNTAMDWDDEGRNKQLIQKFPAYRVPDYKDDSYEFGVFAVDQTLYLENTSFEKFPDNGLDESKFAKNAGKAGGVSNDRFYITYKNASREGMVLPVLGGDKDMFRYAFWRPTAAEGNPALAGQDNITYYLWEADAVSKDNQLGSFNIDLKNKKGKGPQLVAVIKSRITGGNSFGSKSVIKSAVYIIEYEVK